MGSAAVTSPAGASAAGNGVRGEGGGHRQSELIFLGSGSSTGVPTPLCVTQPTDPPCYVCHMALESPPEINPYYRTNPSVIIRYYADDVSTGRGVEDDLLVNGSSSSSSGSSRKEKAELKPEHERRDSAPHADAHDSQADASHSDAHSVSDHGIGDVAQGGGVSPPRYIQIDCGKCFREQVLRWFVRYSIPTIDSLVLTHEHADAILGLDDIRGLQPAPAPLVPSVKRMPVYLTPYSMASVNEKFPYLVTAEQREQLFGTPAAPKGMDISDTALAAQNGSGQEQQQQQQQQQHQQQPPPPPSKPAVFRRVTQLDWRLIDGSLGSSFVASGLHFTTLPVLHGDDYVSLGFEFGEVDRVVYISDVSRIPDATMKYLDAQRMQRGRPALLVIDSLQIHKPHETHFYLPETLEAIRAIQPLSAYLIGMTHQFDHDKVNAELKLWSEREGITVELSRDGLRVPLRL